MDGDKVMRMRSWSKQVKDPVQLKQKIRDVPGLLKHLRKSSGRSAVTEPSEPCPSQHTHEDQECVQNFPCAGRALRNAFLSHGPYPVKDRVQFARIIRRSYAGAELVQWLQQQCPLVQCRRTAAGVWQTLVELGILLSVDQSMTFHDSNTYYQFSFEECQADGCRFGDDDWQKAARLLLGLVTCDRITSISAEDKTEQCEISPRVLQLQALERLTSTVQNELAVTLARKALKTRTEETGQEPTGHVWTNNPSHTEQSSVGASAVCVRQKLKLPRRTINSRCDVVSGSPQRILERLLDELHLECEREGRKTETLLDDFLLTYLVFMSTSDLCQALLGQYCTKRCRGTDVGAEALQRKRKVLHLVSQWTAPHRDFLRDEEHVKAFLKTLYRYVLDDLYEYPVLEKDLKEFQKHLGMQRRHTVDEYSPHRKNKTLFHQLSVKENWLQSHSVVSERHVFLLVYVTMDSYVSVLTHTTIRVCDLLAVVAERMECVEEDVVLVAVTCSGEKRVLQANNSVCENSERLQVCRTNLSDIMNPFTDNSELKLRPVRLLSMNTWDAALALTHFDWSLFSCVHEQELMYHTVRRHAGHTAALDLLLQRCNHVQLWVMTEVLLCVTLTKRVQLLKKFIKIAAHCKAQRNLHSFFAIIMGLNTAAVSRLSHTWEKVPGKFKKLFSELEMLTDPSLNHKVYRETFRKMKPPKIPFLPLMLKDITFIHEGNKTFLDNLVNFEKLHMIADAIRFIQHCQTGDNTGNKLMQKDGADVRNYIHNLHVIDNQQTLFELSHRLEPRV